MKLFPDWAKRLLGIKADTFVTVQQVQMANSSLGDVGQGLNSNVVMAPVQWVMRTFTQAEAIVQRRRSGEWQKVAEHSASELLATPNQFYDGDALTKALLLSYFLDGNGYWLKARDELRTVRELWYVPHWMIEPKWPRNGSTFISHYAYRPENGVERELDPRDVVHIRFGLDPRNPRSGLSPIRAALREVLTDEEASGFSAHILSNMGVPGLLISPKDVAALPTQEDVAEMKAYMQESFTGKNRGKALVIGAPTEVNQFGFDPNRLMLGPLRDISEERICAMLGLPAAVVGFGAGLQQTKVGATMRELVRLARVNCVEPTQMSISRQLSRQLLPDFEARPQSARIIYDNAGVSMFQEDETEVAKRSALLYRERLATREEARSMVGLSSNPVGEFATGVDPNSGTDPGNRIAGLLEGHHPQNGDGA